MFPNSSRPQHKTVCIHKERSYTSDLVVHVLSLRDSGASHNVGRGFCKQQIVVYM